MARPCCYTIRAFRWRLRCCGTSRSALRGDRHEKTRRRRASGQWAAGCGGLAHQGRGELLRKLLDELVVLDPDDFQLIEWLYICDTIDAVYKPDTNIYPASLSDEIAEVLQASGSSMSRSLQAQTDNIEGEEKRRLFLDPLIEALEKEEGAEIVEMARAELIDRVVRPFLGSLGMLAFESRYGGGEVDKEGVWDSVVADAKGVE